LFNILYVDDEAALLEIGKLFLEGSGEISVDTATSAPAALTLMDTKSYDAIIADYQMPEMDGIAFLKGVRNAGNTIPFILFTGRGREEIVIQALNEGADFYLQKGGEPRSQFVELTHKIRIAIEHHQAVEKIQSLTRLYAVLYATNKAIVHFRTKSEFFSEICRILVETGGFRMAWIGLADQAAIWPVTSDGHVNGYLDNFMIPIEDVTHGRGPTGRAYREGKYYVSNDISRDPCMEPWRKNALERGYRANAAFPFALGTENAGVLNIYAPVTGFFDEQTISLLEELAVEISFALRTIDEEISRKSAEKLLRESEKQYRTLVENVIDIVYQTDLNGTVTFVTPSALPLLGYDTLDELIGRPITTLWAKPEKRNELLATMKENGYVNDYEVIILKRDGTQIPVSISSHFYHDNTGRIAGVEGIIRDISERKHSEKALRESEAQLKRAEEIGRSGSWEFRLSENAVTTSEGTRIIYGLGKTHWTIDEVQKLPLPEYRPLLDTALRDLIAGKSPYNIEFKIRRPSDGAVLDIHSIAEYDPGRNVVFGVIHDITEQKRAAEALIGSEALFQAVFSQSTQLTGVLDLQGRLTRANAAAMALIGTDLEHIKGKPFWETPWWADDPDTQGVMKDAITRAVHGETVHFDAIHKDTEGNVHYIDFFLKPVVDTKGNIIALLPEGRDITEREQSKEALTEKETMFQTVFENSPYPISINSTPDGKFIAVNAAFLRSSEYTEQEVLGKNPVELGLLSLGDFVKLTAQMVLHGKLDNIPMTTKSKSGKRVNVQYSTIPIKINGKPAMMTMTAEITKLKRVEEELLEKNLDLQESEEKFRVTFDTAQSALIILENAGDGMPGKIIDVNTTAYTQLGYTKDELCSKNFLDLDAEEYRDEIVRQMTRLSMQKSGNYESVRIRKNGSRFPVEINIHRAVMNGNEVIMTSARDITERKQTEEALHQEEAQYRRIYETATEGIWGLDEGFRIQFVNPMMAQMLGYSIDEIVGHHVTDFVVQDEMSDAEHHFEQRRKGLKEQFERRYKRKDGSIITLLVSASPVFGDDGMFKGSFAMFTDITDRKQAEKALLESEQRYRELVENLNDVIFTVDPNGIITYVSPIGERLYGYSSSDLLGKPFTSIVFREDLNGLVKRFQDIKHGIIEPFEWRLIAKNGDFIWVRTSTKPVLDGTGTTSYFGIISDISQQKLAEDAIKLSNHKLNLLASITRHDITNQLMALVGYLELSRKYLNNPDKIGEFIDKEKVITGIINNQIIFTKDYENLGVKAPVWQNVSAVIKQIIAGLPMKDIQIEVVDPLPEIFADPLFEKVFYNLIDNAFRYGGEKMTTIRILSQKSESGVVISVENDGEGIPADDKMRLFERGFGKNTGLGLFLSREILSITGITITETGDPGKGARFEILVPEEKFRFHSL
jgi:PAS domain S-box-containing protein